jgi:hypothetical protein
MNIEGQGQDCETALKPKPSATFRLAGVARARLATRWPLPVFLL